MGQFAQSTSIRGPSGGTAQVEDNRLCVNVKSEFQQAVADGRAFSWASLDKAAAAGDTVFVLENNSTDLLLCIEKVIITVGIAGGSVCPVFVGSGVALSGTTSVSGVNLNRKSGNSCVPISTAITDETVNAEAAGSWAGRLYMPQCLPAVPYTIDVGGAVRLPYDHFIGVDAIGGGDTANVTFIGYYVAA